MSQFPTVAIVILNWNNAPDTIDCLHSVAKLDYPNYTILVVDNGSTDDSVAKISAHFPTVEILETGKNLGYAEGNNVGIRWVMQKAADYVFVLNNDTLVEPAMLTKLVQAAELYPELGMAGPLMYCIEPKDILFAAGSFIDWSKGKIWHRGMFQPAARYAGSNQPEPVDFISGCGVLVRRQLIEVAGILDPIYYLNFEDIEWSVRANRYGFQVWYVPQAVMWHKISASLGQESAANTYYTTRNALHFFWHNASGRLRWLSVAHIIFSTLRTIGAWTLKPRYKSETFQRRRKANLLALRDFFQGRFGQMGPDVALVCYPKR